MNFYETLPLVILSVLLYIYWSFKKAYSFFEQNGIPYIKPNLFFGNMTDAILLRKTLAQVYLDIYRRLEPHKFGGFYMMKKRMIMIRDPDLIKTVLIKDFADFHDRGVNVNVEVEPLGYNLFNMRGDEWKNLRIKLNGTFTTGKMKMMFPLIQECGRKLNNIIDKIPSEESFDIKDLASRFTTDVIGTCAFGLETGSLDDPNSKFRQMGKKIFKFRYQPLLRILWPSIPLKLIKLLKLTFFEEKVQHFFKDIVENTVKYREENKVTRNDFLDLLIALKNNTVFEKFQDSGDVEELEKFLAQIGDKRVKSNVEMTSNLLAAHCLIFFAAGFETTSTALSFCMFELSQNQEIQNKVREEINTVLQKNSGEISYETMKQMNYTDLVIAETLRKFPPASFSMRECSKNYKIPDSEVVIPAKTPVIIPIYGLHSDEKYYDNPEEFRPERFTEEEKSTRPNYTYIPFGEGPRICIGERFAKMEVKIGLIFMMKDFSYRLSSKTELPLEFAKNFGFVTAKNGIWLHRDKI